MVKLIPVGDRAILKLIEIPAQTASGILLTSPQENHNFFEVIHISGNTKIEVGDRVVCAKHWGDDIVVEGEKYKIIDIEHILWTLPKND